MTELTASARLPIVRERASQPHWLTLGIAFGLLSIGAILLYGPIGVSATYPRLFGAVSRVIAPAYPATNAYLVKVGGLLKPETMLVVGLLIGGFLASRFHRGAEHAPALETIHPSETSPRRRYLDAFLGGVLILFGARLAGGCTSGHIISGITQLAVSGLLFGAAVFATGILSAKLLKGGR